MRSNNELLHIINTVLDNVDHPFKHDHFIDPLNGQVSLRFWDPVSDLHTTIFFNQLGITEASVYHYVSHAIQELHNLRKIFFDPQPEHLVSPNKTIRDVARYGYKQRRKPI